MTSQPTPPPAYYQPPVAPQPSMRNGLGTAALAVGIVGLVFAFVPFMWWVGFILGILAAVFGFVARGRVKRQVASNAGSALTGIITGILAIVISTAFFVAFLAALGEAADDIDHAIDDSTTTGSVTRNGEITAERGEDYDFSHLKVTKGGFGLFEGSIVVENTTSERSKVFVTVAAFRGQQNLGELNGSATMKPHSSSKIELTSLDDFARATDYQVEISGF